MLMNFFKKLFGGTQRSIDLSQHRAHSHRYEDMCM
jgi:hypothetical protein